MTVPADGLDLLMSKAMNASQAVFLATERGPAEDISGILKDLVGALRASAARERALREALRAVMLDEMGGMPDLFWPTGGWESWDENAKALLAAGGQQ